MKKLSKQTKSQKESLAEWNFSRNDKNARWESERPARIALGRAFERAREEAGISRTKMAKMAGIAWGTLRKFESGQYVRREKLVASSLVNALKNKQLQVVWDSIKTFPGMWQNMNALTEFLSPQRR